MNIFAGKRSMISVTLNRAERTQCAVFWTGPGERRRLQMPPTSAWRWALTKGQCAVSAIEIQTVSVERESQPTRGMRDVVGSYVRFNRDAFPGE